MSFKTKLFWSASLLILGAAGAPAWAQQSAPGAVDSEQREEERTDGDVSRPDQDESTEEIIVTGVRGSLIEALQVKREATQIVDSIVAEDVGKLPDNQVVEALQRVTGVQVTNRGAGEVGAVFIRGLPDITTTLNGRLIFTAAGRQFALQDIPANFISRIDVYKTRAAEQIETGIAGQIDVLTRRPFDFRGFAFSAAARGIYHEQADEINPNVNALVSNRWETGIGDVGALLNVSYARTRFRDQTVTAGAMVPFATPDSPPPGFVPLQRFFTGFTPGLDRGLPTAPGSTITIGGRQVPYLLSRDAVFASDFTGERERPAVNAALQWSPDDSSVYTFEFVWEGFRQQAFNNLHFTFVDWWGSLGPNPGSTITLFPDTNIIKTRLINFPFGFNSGDHSRGKTDSFIYALNGKWTLGDRFNIAADVAYQTSKFSTEFIAMRTTRVARSVTVDFNPGNGIPSWEFDNNSLMTDPAQWTVGELFDNAGSSKGEAITFTVDADYEFDAGVFERLSFGLRYDDRSAADAFRTQFAPFLGRPFSQFDPGLHHVNRNFFDGRSNVPSAWVVASGPYLAANADDIRRIYQQRFPNIQTSEALALVPNFDVDERTMAAYLQGDFEQDLLGRPLRLQAGVRYVNVDTETSFANRLVPGAPRTSGSGAVSDFLPSLTLRYDLTNNLRLRFNYGETLRRPNFGDLNPNLVLTGDLTNVGFGTGSGGNPNLGPARAKNYDLGLEWYFRKDSAVYGTVFRREIDGLVVPLRQVLTIAGSGQNTDRFVVVRPSNASSGVLEGAELGFVLFPELPGLLNGFGVQGSFTWLDSSQNIPTTNNLGEIIGQERSQFFGVSDFSYNLTLAYDRGPVDMRASYVWRNDFLNNNEARLFANPIGIWRRPEKSLDFQLTYRISDQLGVTFDAVNLTDEINQSYYKFADAGGPVTHNHGNTIRSRTFALGVRYSMD